MKKLEASLLIIKKLKSICKTVASNKPPKTLRLNFSLWKKEKAMLAPTIAEVTI